MHYILNKRSGVLHRLPAPESCNTDQIADEQRFFTHGSETVVGYIGARSGFRACRRCFTEGEGI